MYIGKPKYDSVITDGNRSCSLTVRHYEALCRCVSIINEHLSPEKILLYGSCARTESTFKSDLDLFVVLSNMDDETKKICREARNAVRHAVSDVEVDIHFGTDNDLTTGSAYSRAVARDGINVGHIRLDERSDGK